MRHLALTVIAAVAVCLGASAQRMPGIVNFPEGSYSPVTNINRNGFPRVLKDGSVIYMTCGEQDPRIEHTRKMAAKMQAAGIDVEFESFRGDHEWQPWRKSLHAFAQKLFK